MTERAEAGQRSNIPLGIMVKLLASLCFVAVAGIIKYLATFPAGQILFMRSVVPAVGIIIYLCLAGKFYQARTGHIHSHAIRATMGALALFCWFIALRLLPLPDVQALLYLTPVVNVVMAWLILGERSGPYRIGALVVGIVGMAVIMASKVTMEFSESAAILGALLCFGHSIFMSLAIIQVRQLTRTELPITIVLYFSVFATIFSLATLPFGWVMPTWEEFWLLIAIGVVGGLGQMLFTLSYRFAPVSIVAPFEYVSLIYAIIIAAIVFNEHASASTLIGAAMIVTGGLVVFVREQRVARKRGL
jgi:drug/metabolite transporter (DMT)-like permease